VKVGDTIGTIDTSQAVEKSIASPPKAPEAPKPVPEPKLQPPEPTKGVSSEKPLRQTEEAWLQKPPVKVEKKEEPSALSKVPQRVKMTKLRKTIATRLLEAKNSTDMTSCMEIRAKEQEAFTKKYGVKLGFMSFFVKATVSALKAYPEINAYIDGDDIVRLATFDIGIAVATDKGLVVPVVRDCDALAFGEIEQKIEEYAKSARNGSLKIEDLRGGSFTITNGGKFGSLLSTPILNIPQSAILGMHSIVKRPIALNNEIVIRPMMYLALSYDHRLVDGKEAVLFLVHIKEHLENPQKLMLDL
jgi:2-oxoglutarate dehydrogenase E2 component (dihydrolipoamide succinyltransferase)